jgi:methionyl-tRNA formyltransferase
MRIVVMGTGPFAVPMFQSLCESSHVVLALVTRPTPPAKGREKSPLNPMREVAERRGLPVYLPESINSDEGRRLLVQLAPDLLVVCDYGQILSADVLAIAPLGGINLHASLLPKYRGAAPIQWSLLNGDRETGVSVIHMTPRLDGGPILAVHSTPIGENEEHPELEQRLARLGIAAVHEAIGALERWDRVSTIGSHQDTTQATKAPRLKKERGAVDWSKSAEQIRNQVRAFKPWPGTFTFWHRAGQEPMRLVIDLAHAVESGNPTASPGHVVVSDGEQLLIATGQGSLALDTIAPAGKRHMAIAEFLRGHRVQVGDVFGPLASRS